MRSHGMQRAQTSRARIPVLSISTVAQLDIITSAKEVMQLASCLVYAWALPAHRIYLFIYTVFIYSLLRHRGSTHYTTNIQNKTQSKNTKH